MFEQEVAHLHKAAQLLKRFENKEWQQVIPDACFPELLQFHENVDYVRGVLASSVKNTSQLDDYPCVDQVDKCAQFFTFQNTVNADINEIPSHLVINRYINAKGQDYRFQVCEHPVEELQDRKKDNVCIARVKSDEKC